MRAIRGTARAGRTIAGLVAAVGLAVTIALAGCSSGAGDNSGADSGAVPIHDADMGPAYDSAGGSGGEAAVPEAGAPPATDSAGRAPGKLDDAAAPLADDRQIIRTAHLEVDIVVPRPDDDAPDGTSGSSGDDLRAALADAAAAGAVKARALATGSGGFVSASDGSGGTISVTLRVPAAQYEAVMKGLADIGRVTTRTESTNDVTDEVVDVASRVKSMTASVERLRSLLAEADELSDIISIESELAAREGDLESLQNREASLKGQVALSTITVTITASTPSVVDETEPADKNGFLGGLENGWHALTVFGSGVAAFVGAILPWSPLLIVAVLLLVWAVRRSRRRHDEAAAQPQVAPVVE